MIGRSQPHIRCSPPSAWIVDEPGRCIKWNAFITTARTPHCSRSALSTERTTPWVASGRKMGSRSSARARRRRLGGERTSPPGPSPNNGERGRQSR